MERISSLIPLVKPYYSGVDPAHDWAHIGRVIANVKMLSQNQPVSIECAMAAAYCHDLINLPKDHPDRRNASQLSAEEAVPLLQKVGLNAEEIKEVKIGIIEHSFSKGLKPSTLLASIVQDADRLDALGAIGILRCAAVNTQMGSRFYDPFDPLAEMRELDDKNFMLDHYFVKLFKLPDLMNTVKGKDIALQRVEYMKDFLSNFLREIR